MNVEVSALAPRVAYASCPIMDDIRDEISACRLCEERFARTATQHSPRPVVWFDSAARILVAGQAPGQRVHLSGQPFTDPSGDRLRDWMGVSEEEFYDRKRVAIVPMAFCFPGYDAKGGDLPPPAVCARTWRGRVMGDLPRVRLTILVGAYAMRYHLGARGSVTETVQHWKAHGDALFALPHPSWRNTGWLKKNPWFGRDVLPRLQEKVREILDD